MKEAIFCYNRMAHALLHPANSIWLCESVGKLKVIGKQGEVKMNEINVHTIADFHRYVQSYGLPNLSICGLGQIY